MAYESECNCDHINLSTPCPTPHSLLPFTHLLYPTLPLPQLHELLRWHMKVNVTVIILTFYTVPYPALSTPLYTPTIPYPTTTTTTSTTTTLNAIAKMTTQTNQKHKTNRNPINSSVEPLATSNPLRLSRPCGNSNSESVTRTFASFTCLWFQWSAL